MKKTVSLSLNAEVHALGVELAKAKGLNFSQLVTAFVQQPTNMHVDERIAFLQQQAADMRKQLEEKQATIDSLLRMLEQERQLRSVTDMSRSAPVGKPVRRSATA